MQSLTLVLTPGMSQKQQRWLELSLLFALLPVALVLPVTPALLLLPALAAVLYCFWLMKKAGKLSKSNLLSIPDAVTAGWSGILIRFAAFAVFSTFLVWWFLPDKLFYVALQKPMLWLAISLFYAVVSVFPQELIYRHFFYWRYSHLLSENYFLVLNAVLFSLAHTLFMNNLVFALTLAGGFLFARTYRKTRSVMLTSIEHAIYGLWLYTVGLGEMLAFPG